MIENKKTKDSRFEKKTTRQIRKQVNEQRGRKQNRDQKEEWKISEGSKNESGKENRKE